jgi:hypothetical protein
MVYRHPDNRRFGTTTLSGYPADVLTIRCSLCPRRYGRYSLAGLVRRLGPDRELDDVFDDLVQCQYHRKPCERPPRKYEARCLAKFMEYRS